MNVTGVKTWRNLATTILVALAVFSLTTVAKAQLPDDATDPATIAAAEQASNRSNQGPAAPDDGYGIATVAEGLKLSGLNKILFIAIAGIGSMIAWVGGMIMDLAIAVFTVGMAQFSRELGLTVAISSMWAIVRDIFNLLFIFGLIYAGFKIILDANDSSSKRTVGMIVLAALLINFSLYVAQVVVDFTNVAAYEIHNMIAPEGTPASQILLGIPVYNTSSQFYLITGLRDNRSAIQNEISPVASSDPNNLLNALVLGFLFLIFYSVLGFVFAACAFILFTRFFVLTFLMIFSPLMFLGWVLPSMKGQSSKWWQQFSSQALVGPAMIFMIYLSLRALQGLGQVNEANGSNWGLLGTITYLLMVTAFLFASLRVAKSFGAYGADMAMNTGKRWGNNIRGSVTGAAGRWTLGAGSNWAQKKFTTWQAKPESGQSRAGRFLRQGLNSTGLERNIIGMTDKGKKAKFGGSRSWEDSNKYVKDRNKRITKDRAGQLFESRIVSGATAGAATPERKAFEQSMRDATTGQLIDQLGEHKDNSAEYKAMVETMSASQFDDVMKAKEEDFSDDKKSKLRSARGMAVLAQLTSNGRQLSSAIGSAEAAQIRALDFGTIMQEISNLRPGQIDEIKKSDKYPTPQKQQLLQAWESAMETKYSNNPQQIQNLKVEEAAKLPKGVFTHRNANQNLSIVPGLNVSLLTELKKNLNTGDYSAIWNEIVTPGQQPSANQNVKNWINTPQNQAKQGANLHP